MIPDSILVTGGTGSFGRAFITTLLQSNNCPSRLIVYSRGEHTQAAFREACGDDDRVRWMIGDIRDGERLRRAMGDVELVVHAAALKRIETGAYNPDEMVKTNILGTMNVIDAAVEAGVGKVIYLSTDKAYQPISPYGQSKAIAESMMMAAHTLHGHATTKFAVTRYGNVWGAQGSVVPKWLDLIANGVKYLPLTHPDCTRFYMSIGEAVKMVTDLMVSMRGGELVIPDWLPAYRLGDLAKAFNRGTHTTGLPQWEKLHENMDANLCSKDARRMTIDELRELI